MYKNPWKKIASYWNTKCPLWVRFFLFFFFYRSSSKDNFVLENGEKIDLDGFENRSLSFATCCTLFFLATLECYGINDKISRFHRQTPTWCQYDNRSFFIRYTKSFVNDCVESIRMYGRLFKIGRFMPLSPLQLPAIFISSLRLERKLNIETSSFVTLLPGAKVSLLVK